MPWSARPLPPGKRKVLLGSSSTKPRRHLAGGAVAKRRAQPVAARRVRAVVAEGDGQRRVSRAAAQAQLERHAQRDGLDRDRAHDGVRVVGPFELAEIPSIERRAVVDEAHGKLARLPRVEHERRRVDDHVDVLRRGHLCAVARGRADVRHAPLHGVARDELRDARSTAGSRPSARSRSPPRRAPRSRPAGTAARAGRRGRRRDRGSRSRRRGPGRSPVRVDMARAAVERSGGLAVGVHDALVRRGHQRGLERARRPVRVRFLQQYRDARDLGRGLRRAGEVSERLALQAVRGRRASCPRGCRRRAP